MSASNPPRIGVSACLLGQPLRYDGTARPHAWLLDTLARQAELVPLCPEAGAGLGVPRPPVQLVKTPAGLRALGVEVPDLDVTEALLAWCQTQDALLATLQGVVLKSRSPSCGRGSTPVHDAERRPVATGSGLFADHLARHHPHLVVVEDEDLTSDAGRRAFLNALGLTSASKNSRRPCGTGKSRHFQSRE